MILSLNSISLSTNEINYLRNKLIRWGRNNFDDFPWRTTKNMWHALVAEIMLQRTRAEQVLPTYIDFTKKYERPEQFKQGDRKSIFVSLGLPQRENLLLKLAHILSEKNLPEGKVDLLELPGVGEYVASAFRSFHQNICDTIIDSNIVRFYGRYYGFRVHNETRRDKNFINLAKKLTPKRSYKDYNYSLIDFTRKICRPKPICAECIFKRKCIYFGNISNT